jgi:hypothetical protein
MEKKYGLFRGMQTGRPLRWIERVYQKSTIKLFAALCYFLIVLGWIVTVGGLICGWYIAFHFITKYW